MVQILINVYGGQHGQSRLYFFVYQISIFVIVVHDYMVKEQVVYHMRDSILYMKCGIDLKYFYQCSAKRRSFIAIQFILP